MTRRRKIVFVVALVVVLGGMTSLIVRSPKEPSYQGKSLSEWLAILEKIHGTNPPIVISVAIYYPRTTETTQCEDAIRHIGTNAVPFLLQMLQARDSQIRFKLADLLNKQRVIKMHILTARERREMAFLAFYILGPDAKPAVPELAKLFAKSDPADRKDIADCFCEVLPSFAKAQYWYSRIGKSPDSPYPVYELSRSNLLSELGSPAAYGEKWAGYDAGKSFFPPPNNQWYLYFQFSGDRVIDSFLDLSGNSNRPVLR